MLYIFLFLNEGLKVAEKTLESYKNYLEESKERFGLISYEIIDDRTIVYTVKKRYEHSLWLLFNHPTRPEIITGGRTETFTDNND